MAEASRSSLGQANHYDVIIVGAGAAGLTAALYAARRAIRTLVLSQDIGGQASTTASIENYPGIDFIDGLDLMMRFKTQAEKYGAVIKLEEVQSIKAPGDTFSVTTAAQTYTASAIIVAYGLTHRHLNVPGEEKFIGHGVSYCATCDAPMMKGKNVVVVGGGNSAMDAALLLSKLCNNVSIITVNGEFRGEHVLIERLQQTKNIQTFTKATVTAVRGDERVSGLSFTIDGVEQTINVDGVFVEIGFTIKPELVKDLVTLDGRNQIIVHPVNNATNVPGIFAAGDVTSINQKQVVISAGEGAKAALGVHQYLQALGKAKKAGLVDWGVTTPMHHDRPVE